ncbi:MAG: hypothetical protein CL946_06000 [Ectothiorhodospiraceae bacterium]|nr:hypothetical protein [Ectothiorhodospiraceae bacterium]
MRLYIYVTLPLLFIASITDSNAQGWEWQNPLPRGYRIYDVEMLADWSAIAVCEDGFIMRSGDGGQSWRLMQVGTSAVWDISAVDERNVWIVLEDGTIMKSSDWGSSWTKQRESTGAETGTTKIEMLDGMRGMAMLGRNIFSRTTDGGETWNDFPSPLSGSEVGISLSAQSPTVWRALGNRFLYVSRDFGNTWILDQQVEFEGLNHLVWEDSLRGWSCKSGSLDRTTDGGATWEEQDVFGFGYFMDVESGAHLNDHIYALSDGSVLVNASFDDGENWNVSLLDNAFENGSVYGMSFANDRVGLVVGGGGRILRTTDGGQSWNITHGIGYLGTISDVHFTTPDLGFALTNSSSILLTTDGGERWIETIPNDDVTLQYASMYSQSSGYAYGYDEDFLYHVYRTEDLGQTWEYVNRVPLPEFPPRRFIPLAITAPSRDTMYISGTNGLFYRSFDGGESFDSLYVVNDVVNQYNSGFELYAFPPSTIVHVSPNGVATSFNAGDNWQYERTQSGRWLSEAQFLTPDIGFGIAGGSFTKTTDGGDTWEMQFDRDNALIHFFNEEVGVTYNMSYKGDRTMASLHWTFNGGEDWEIRALNEPMGWQSWHWFDPNTGWAYGSSGLLRATKNGGVVGLGTQTIMPGDIRLSQSYPNPVSLSGGGSTSIVFTLPEAGYVSLSVFDPLGRKVATLKEGQMQAGSHQAAFNVTGRNLAPGTYYYTLRTNATAKTKKLLLVE